MSLTRLPSHAGRYFGARDGSIYVSTHDGVTWLQIAARLRRSCPYEPQSSGLG